MRSASCRSVPGLVPRSRSRPRGWRGPAIPPGRRRCGLDGLRTDEDLAGWHPRDGRPGISPAQLATALVLQFLPDRDAAEAVRCRTDFKYAPGPGPDDPGFRHSVPGDFRGRLLEEDGRATSRTWPWPGSRRQGWSASAPPTRRLRPRPGCRAGAAPEELARTAPQALDGLADEERGRRYGRQAPRIARTWVTWSRWPGCSTAV
jgi:Transposase domain (DUF772)